MTVIQITHREVFYVELHVHVTSQKSNLSV